ncbi:GtrA family protein [Epibacterium sp. SM1979]|uniref:GtrA family protein n=1 Tax=Tritonibacter litoralis TaxID=2662264 RepID=A0A843YIJ0_9RHOB|nr:GtrA family protein [Tritonibacter litoralis]MQQ09618.1 GtrA family protein [Tritonibacter litoralis]
MPVKPSSLLRQFITFSGVGAIATACHYVVLFVLVVDAGVQPVTASFCGAVVGAIVSYVLNRAYTFQSTAQHRKTAPKFFLIAALAVISNTALIRFLIVSVGLPYQVAQVLTTAVLIVVTFGLNKVWSFRD